MFILKMPRVRIGDLVEVLIEAYAGRFGFRADEIAIERIGVRPGEKVDEALMTLDESWRARELGDMWVVPRIQPTEIGPRPTSSSAPADVLGRQDLRDLLDSAGWLAPESIPKLA